MSVRWRDIVFARRRFLNLLSLGVLLSGCQDPEVCDICTSSSLVRGQVRDRAGVPLVHAAVSLEAFYDRCGGVSLFAFDGRTGDLPRVQDTDAAGRYEMQLRAMSAPRRYCTRVTVTSPPDHRDSTIVDREILFGADWEQKAMPETVIDVQLVR